MATWTYYLFQYTGTAPTFSNLTLASPHVGLFSVALINDTGNHSIDLSATGTNNQWIIGGIDTIWSDIDNWYEFVPNGTDAVAQFYNNNGAGFGPYVTAQLDENVTLGYLLFYNAATAFTIAPLSNKTLTMNGTNAEIEVLVTPTYSYHEISAPIILATDLTVDVVSSTGGYGLDISGAISGGNGYTLTKTGSGPLSFSGSNANTYSGLTEVANGTLTLNKSAGINAIGSGGLQIDPNGSVVLGASNQIADSATLTVNGTFAIGTYSETVAALAGAGTVTTGGGVLTISGNTSPTFSGIISGTGAIAKAGTGTLTLNGVNTYSGGTAINAGALQVGADNNLGNVSGNVTFNGGTLDFSGGFTTSRGIILNDGGGIFDTGGNTVTLTGLISSTGTGIGTLTKNGIGVLDINHANSYTGATIINNGILLSSNATSLGSTSGITVTANGELELNGSGLTVNYPLTLNGGILGNTSNTNTFSGPVTLATDSTVDADAGTLIITGAIGDGGHSHGITKVGPGIVNLAATNTYSGVTAVNTGTLQAGIATNAFGSNSPVVLGNTTGVVLDLNGNSNMIGSLNGGAASQVSLGSATLTTGALNTTDTFYGVITGTGGLTKIGTGTMNLSGMNTYSGATTVSGGTLQAGIATSAFGSNSAVALANIAGVVLDLNSNSNTIGSLNGGAASQVSLGSAILTTGTLNMTDTFYGVISGSGGLTKTGTGTMTLSGANTYSGATTVSSGTLQAGIPNAFGSNSAVTLANTAGAVLNLANFNNTIGSLNGGGTTGGNVILGSAILTTGALNTPDAFAGAISGTGGLTKTGNGTMNLAGTNTYSGATIVSGGVLQAGSTSAFGGNSAVTLANMSGVALDLNGFDNTIGSLNGGGINGGNVTTGGSILTTGALNTPDTFYGVISGSGGLTKTGTGTMILSGANTYSGATTVSGGTLQAGSTSAFGINSAVMLANISGVVLDLANLNNTIGSLNGGGGSGGNVTLGSATLTTGTLNTTDTFSGVISGTGALTKTGSGTMTLFGINTYSGGTTINAGTLALSANGSLVSAGAMNVAGTFDISSINASSAQVGDLSGAGTVALGAKKLTAGTGTAVVTFSGMLVDGGIGGGTGGRFAKTGTGTLILSGANSYTGGTLVSLGTLQGDATSLQGAIINSAAVVFNQTTIGTYAGLMSGTGTLTSVGPSTLILSAANTYNGPTIVSGGVLQAGIATNAFGSNSAVTLANTAGVALSLNGFDNTIGSLNGGGTTGGNVATDGSILTTGALNTTDTFYGAISGSGGLTKIGAGTMTLSGANTYSGATTVSGGTLQAGSTSAFGSNSAVTLVNTSGVILNLANFSNTIGSLNGGGGSGGNVTLGSATLTTGTLNTTDTFSGVISGTGALIKTGTGTMTLFGINTYSGGTTIGAGTLALSANGSLVSAGAMNVAGTFDISSINASSAQVGDLSGAGTVALGENNLTAGTGTASVTFSGTLVDGGIGGGTGGSLTKTGTGTLILSGANSYTGGTLVSLGTLQGDATSLQGAITNSAAVVFNQTSIGIYAGSMSGTGTLTSIGPSTLILSATNTYTGATIVSGGVLQAGIATNAFGSNSAVTLANTAGVALSLNGFDNTIGSLNGGGTTGGNVATDGSILTTGTLNTTDTFYGIISGTGGLTKTGNGRMTLSGVNTYTGATTVSGGILQAGIATRAFGSNSAVTLANTSGVVLNLANLNNTIGSLNGGGGSGGNVTLGSATLTTGALNTTDTFYGVISGTGGLTKTGTGTMNLSGLNTYTGATTVNGGTLQAGSTSAFGNNSAITLANTAGVVLDLFNSNNTIGSLNGGGSNGGNVTLGSAILTTGTLNTNDSFAGTISGAGGLTKTGIGTLILTGNSSVGSAVVSAGTLAVNGGFTSAAALTVNSGATLKGNGTITTSNVSVSGTVAAGNSIGILNIVGDLTLEFEFYAI